MNDDKSYEYEVSLIIIHIIYVYISFKLNYILYKNMLISKFAVKNYWDLNILILKICTEILTLNFLWLKV